MLFLGDKKIRAPTMATTAIFPKGPTAHIRGRQSVKKSIDEIFEANFISITIELQSTIR